MKSRLAQRKERALQARRMRMSLEEMTADSIAAEDRAIAGAVNYLIAPFVTAGLAAGYFWWRGDEMTLGHYLAMGIAAAVLGFGVWRRQRRSTR